MKTIVILVLASVFSVSASADKLVKGHIKQDGTYVAPYVRSSPNNVQYDNYSTKGNTNPYTGERGSQRDTTYDYKPYKSNSNN